MDAIDVKVGYYRADDRIPITPGRRVQPIDKLAHEGANLVSSFWGYVCTGVDGK